MKEILITSSVLIATLMLLRRLFREKLSRRIQYALWLLVALRLLVPANLPAISFSVLSAAEPIEEAITLRWENPRFAAREDPTPAVPQTTEMHETVLSTEDTSPAAENVKAEAAAETSAHINAETVVHGIWAAGITAVGLFFLLSNLQFWKKLRKNRRRYDTESSLPVYLIEEDILSSSCLFGLFRPAIYLTPAALSSEEALRHVLLHEETHAKHLDTLWSLVRCVCLAVYWFDPLVWAAAFASRTDCELACDESVVARLGKDARISYGETLLSLVSSQRRRENPLLAATTMTAGKKELKARITRIVRQPKKFVFGTAAVLLMTVALAACTFTNGKESGKVQPLNGRELRGFNEQFFNSDAVYGEDGWPVNLHNQFANPINLYEKPEEINLYDLFYLESSEAPTDGEIRSVLETDPENLSCPAYKLSADRMDEILLANTGLTRDETKKNGLDSFTYSEEADAYFWMHGDTNYCGDLNFLCGTREKSSGGDLIRLYHRSTPFSGKGWYCVTLEPQDDNSFHFVSNQECEHPVIPMLLPEGKAEAKLSLNDLEPYVPPEIEQEIRPASDFDGDYHNRLENWDFDGNNIIVYRAADGVIRAAVVQEDGSYLVFLTGLNDECSAFFFDNLFGRSGFFVSHNGKYDEHSWGTVYDFFTFAEDGRPELLLRIRAPFEPPQMLDLDGDGKDELVSEAEVFFEQDGKLFCADLQNLTAQEFPELTFDCAQWDSYGRYCRLTEYGYDNFGYRWTGKLFYDGENLLVYPEKLHAEEHVVAGAADGVPAEVVREAKAFVEGCLAEEEESPYPIDDWRIESFSAGVREKVGETMIAGWAFNYEFHTTQPEKVVQAGGRYVTEDGWVSPGYPGCDWLFFEETEDGYRYLWHGMLNDMVPGAERWEEYLEEKAAAALLISDDTGSK